MSLRELLFWLVLASLAIVLSGVYESPVWGAISWVGAFTVYRMADALRHKHHGGRWRRQSRRLLRQSDSWPWKVLADPTAAEDLRIEALQDLPVKRKFGRRLTHLMSECDGNLLAELLVYYAKLETHPPPLGLLGKVLPRCNPRARQALARCLRHRRAPGRVAKKRVRARRGPRSPQAREVTTQDLLIALVDGREERTVRMAALESLAAVGNRNAIVAITELDYRAHGAELGLRRRAIETIQERLNLPGDRGELSVARDDSGDLSLSDQSGALSKTTKEA